MKRASSAKNRDPDATRAALIEAAANEMEEVGFEQTNTNKIAARAGFAPQTFYRHFDEKADIFLAVYTDWVAEEQSALDSAHDALSAAKAIVQRHKKSLRTRRTLRSLSLTDPRIRSARAQSRLQQIARLRETFPHLADAPLSKLAASLLMIERLADACAESEFHDLGIAKDAALGELANLIRVSFARRRNAP